MSSPETTEAAQERKRIAAFLRSLADVYRMEEGHGSEEHQAKARGGAEALTLAAADVADWDDDGQ